MPYNYIFFDLDGTLVDPKLGITKGVQYALDKFGISESVESLTHFIGPPLNKSFQKYYGFTDKQVKEAIKYYREYYLPIGIYEGVKYKGIIELLINLTHAKKKLYVVTSKPTFLAREVVRFHKIDGYFKTIKGPEPDLSNADKTTLINETLIMTGEENKNTAVMIGDRKYDIVGAKNNQIDSIGVLYGYGSAEELTIAAPTHLATTVEDLGKYL